MEFPPITFDAEGKLRVLDPEKFTATEELEKEARAFVSKVQDFSTTVHGIVQSLAEQGARIEVEKLKAIGQRNLVESERELRRRRQRELQALVDERSAELQRLTVQYEALLRIEAQQKETIDKLLNNEAIGV